MSSAGILLDETSEDEDFFSESEEEELVEESSLDTLSLDDLKAQLEDAIANEDYELASKIRDEMNKRSS